MHAALCLLLIAAVSTNGTLEPSPMPQEMTQETHFDRNRDASADLQAALAEAHRTGRRVLVDVGGAWCMYCAQMDAFFQSHPDVLALRDQKFITVRVFYGEGQKNEKALAGLPPPEGIPHFYVLGDDGKLLRSQHVIELRESGDYSAGKMKQFLEEWGAPRMATSAPSGRIRFFR